MTAPRLITDNLDLWTAAVTPKANNGRGNNGQPELTGIKKLRELILELAVRGKLVPQDPADEPASVLLEKIAAEKNRLVKEGKIKKPKPLPAVGEGEQPFALPEGWEWFRVGTYLEFQYGKALPAKDRNEEGNVEVFGSNGVVGFHDVALTEEPCLVIGRKGSAGAVNKTTNPSWTTDVAYFLVPPEGFDLNFTFLMLQSLCLEKIGKGIKPGLNRNEAYFLVSAIPPLAEQHRIVEKVDELMALCDRLEQQTSDQLAAHETLVETLLDTLTRSADATELAANWTRLQTHFDTLFTTESSIDRLKQTILQLAVMGRLVPQDPNDEPADLLFQRLAQRRQQWLEENMEHDPECRTMLKKLNRIKPASAHFGLPSNWITVHLIQLCRLMVDCHNKTAPYAPEGIPIIRTSNIRDREFRLPDLKFVNEETYEYWSRRCPPKPYDIIFTREAPMGEAAIIPEGAKWCLGQRTMLIRPMHEFVSGKYLLLALTEPHLLERASEKAIGSTVKHLRVGDVEKLSVPLPPMQEQQRIVQKTDELLAICDQIKVNLNQADQTRQKLAEAVVAQTI
ncbi:restriction endonuclease subunit S [Desulfurivibrio sp. C05AmB]|uniref:restriction endonuclease subunit S n=1 Tax=Desulfurivibrio sp. C05AmB TaxID=3374371 RepID=UPI00376F0359